MHEYFCLINDNRRPAANVNNASGFLLSILSPVWRAKLCGDIGGAARWQLALEGREAGLFSKLVALGSGASVTIEGGLGGAVELGLMADRYHVEAVQEAVEEAVVRLLTVESCGRVLACSSGSGLARVERASRELALREFDEFAGTAGFIELGEEVLGMLLDDDELTTEREERVFDGVVRWIKGASGGEVRGSGLLGKVRFPFMDVEYLKDLSGGADGELAGLDLLVGEALGLKSMARDEWDRQRLRHLNGKARLRRRSRVRWEDYVRGGEQRLAAGHMVCCVSVDGDYIFAGLWDGNIKVWRRSTLEQERTMRGHRSAVRALLCVGGRLVSGSDDGGIRVWDAAAGRCDGVLEGHARSVTSLATSGSRVFSGSEDGTVKSWWMEGEASTWRCERTLDGQRSSVLCLVAFGDSVACGSKDGGIRVWSTETWAPERTLRGHWGRTCSLVAGGRRLISSSYDGTVQVWSTETWESVQTVKAYPEESGRYIVRLAVSGGTLVGGSMGSASGGAEVRVWDLETLRSLHALRVQEGNAVEALACDEEEVCAGAGHQVMVWGRRG